MSDIPSRALRETLRDQLEPPLSSTSSISSGCLDADRLAAWSEGTLNRRDRAMAESHAATCARCQALLAAMAKIAAPPPARKWWQVPTVRWLVPIAAMSSLAVVVWMNVPSERQAVPRSATMTPAAVVEERPADLTPRSASATGTLEPSSASKPAERRDAEAGQGGALAKSNAAPSAGVQTAPSSVVQPERASAPTAVALDAFAPAPVQPPVELRSEAPRALAETVTIAPAEAVFKSRALVEIASPNPSARWRIVAGKTVERSTDGGATWQAQSTGSSVRLTAGAAPSPTICWLVGPGGVVLVSKDGVTWQRVAFPEAIDLIAIRATDRSSATATAADGRVFSTTDGGKTWR